MIICSTVSILSGHVSHLSVSALARLCSDWLRRERLRRRRDMIAEREGERILRYIGRDTSVHVGWLM